MRDATRRDYFNRGWKPFARWLEERRIEIAKVEAEHVEAYLARRGQQVVASTASWELRGIAFVLECLVSNGLLDVGVNPGGI